MTLEEQLNQYDIIRNKDAELHKFFRAGPAGIRTTQAFSQDCRWDSVDDDRVGGCIRNKENAISQEGGLAVLFGNIAKDGCIVKLQVWMNLSGNLPAEQSYLKAKKMR